VIMSGKGPIRALHVVREMSRGGYGMWLTHILCHISHKHFQSDFLVATLEQWAYDDDLQMVVPKFSYTFAGGRRQGILLISTESYTITAPTTFSTATLLLIVAIYSGWHIIAVGL
jgi:hypothetical protein